MLTVYLVGMLVGAFIPAKVEDFFLCLVTSLPFLYLRANTQWEIHVITFISTLIFYYGVTSLLHRLCHEELAAQHSITILLNYD